jgi:hypothetical protein
MLWIQQKSSVEIFKTQIKNYNRTSGNAEKSKGLSPNLSVIVSNRTQTKID